MKKLLVGTLLVFGFLVGFKGLDLEAAEFEESRIDSNEVELMSAQTFLNPTRINGRTHTYYNVTVSVNVGGNAHFSFNPGISGAPTRSGPGSFSRNFSQSWTSNSITTYTYWGSVTTQDYGPAPRANGTAVISY
ncbi:hypothetical protein SAMN04488134_101509 [Amphibacillus marinus]|uniref:Uncharacterized protein n=1 Tax=Amphibacillus marinus TaxID=872970 RepID=A0A1H8I3E4_9BACI|nr:hypothetical protein [Amphibacillus marinus]SEN62842.1 hypothetical protein SAMN04488134_101509 [Amphibacillus marinus]